MDLVRAIFAHGVEAIRDEDAHLWRLTNGSDRLYSELPSVETATRLRLITVTERRDIGDDRTLLLTRRGSVFLADASNLSHGEGVEGALFQQHHIAYLIGAVAYHCVRLTEIYAHFVRSFSESCTTNRLYDDATHVSYGRQGTHQGSPYYEFDAFVSAARRTYDVSRYLLWRTFGEKHDTPTSFARTLPRCKGLPADVLDRLTESWEIHGTLITAYRDCLHHYVPVDFGIDSVSMERASFGGWMARAPIPDNPEARSKTKFTYARGHDALTFAHDCATELLGVMNLIVATARAARC